jgi:hypothetical protein
MPISYTIDSDKGRVVVRFTGTVRDEDLFTTFHELYDDPRHRIGMPELTDCRELERAELTGVGLRALARMTATKLDPAQRPWKVAVVAPQSVVYGLARMYELLREGSPEHVEVFRELAAAEQWLEEPG